MIRTMRVSSLSGEKTETRAELDSHADTCVVGKHALIIHDYGRPVNVTGYDASEGTVAKDLRTVSAGLAYDDPRSGSVAIIVLHQAIEIPHLEMSLLCPMQLRMNDAKVDELPKFLADNPSEDTHVITIPNIDES